MVRLLQTPHSGSTRRLRGRSVVIGFLASRYVSSKTLTARFPFLHDILLTSPSDPESKLGTDYSSTSHCASTTTSSVTGMIASLGKETNFSPACTESAFPMSLRTNYAVSLHGSESCKRRPVMRHAQVLPETEYYHGRSRVNSNRERSGNDSEGLQGETRDR